MRVIFYISFLFTCMFSPLAFSEINHIKEVTEEETKLNEQPIVSAIDQRLDDETKVEESKFSLIPHKPTYLLPFNFNDKLKDYSLYQDSEDLSDTQRTEIKYQISFKVPLIHHIGHLPISGYIAYTQTSFWQAYNTEESAPFRETNYEPELFLRWDINKELPSNWYLKGISMGFAHQSNGRSEPISRSWNRLNSSFVFGKENVAIAITPWYRIEESEADDDNPDLLDYYGHGQMTLVYKNADRVFAIISRNNIESGFSKGSVQASLSFPLFENVRGYVQVFSGYGNSLIEYNVYTNTIGIGISINDFL